MTFKEKIVFTPFLRHVSCAPHMSSDPSKVTKQLSGEPSGTWTLDRDTQFSSTLGPGRVAGGGGGFEGEVREVRPELETSRRIDLGGGRKEAHCEYFCSLKTPVG